MPKAKDVYVVDEQKCAFLFYGGFTGTDVPYRKATDEEILEVLQEKLDGNRAE